MYSRCVIKHQSDDVFRKETVLIIKILALPASVITPDGLLGESLGEPRRNLMLSWESFEELPVT